MYITMEEPIQNEELTKNEEPKIMDKIVLEECQELKNIKYKTMLLTGVALHETKSSNDFSNLEKYLENEKNNNSNEPWCKLNKTTKTKKIIEYIDIYCQEQSLDIDEKDKLIMFLKDCLDKKKLARVKDVIYDKNEGIVKEIPALMYTKSTRHFTLKNIDKRISTLKSLSQKKVNITIRHKEIDSDTEEPN